MKDLTCPLHGTSLIKQALRHRPPRRARGSIKTTMFVGGQGRGGGGLKPRHFPHASEYERECIIKRKKTARASIYNYIYYIHTHNEITRRPWSVVLGVKNKKYS